MEDYFLLSKDIMSKILDSDRNGSGGSLPSPNSAGDLFLNFSSNSVPLQEQERIYWDKQKRAKIDFLLGNALLDTVVSIEIPMKMKQLLKEFCAVDEQHLSYDLLRAIGFTRIVKNRGNIEEAKKDKENLIIPQLEIINTVWLQEVKELLSSLLTKQLSEGDKAKLLQRIMKNEFPFGVVDLAVATMIACQDLPKSIQDEYNVMNISTLSGEEYKKAKEIGVALYWQEYCKKISEQESHFNKEKLKNIVMVVTTMYKNTPPYRKELAIDFFKKLQSLGVPCVVGDGGSDQDFLDILSSLPNIFVKHLHGQGDKQYGSFFGNDKRAALAAALEIFHEDESRKLFVQTEPEKKRIADPLNLLAMADAMQGKSIVLANRKDTVSMPRLQAYEEKRAAEGIVNMMGYPGKIDFFQNASISTKDGAQYFLNYEPIEKESYDGVMTPYIHAYQYGLPVGTAEVDAVYSRKEKIYEQRGSGRNIFTKKRVFAQYLDLLPKIEHQIKYTDLCLALQKDFSKDFATIKIVTETKKGLSLLDTFCSFSLHIIGDNALLKQQLVIWSEQEKTKLGKNYDLFVA